MLVGFVNLEPKGINSFDIIDPIPVTRVHLHWHAGLGARTVPLCAASPRLW